MRREAPIKCVNVQVRKVTYEQVCVSKHEQNLRILNRFHVSCGGPIKVAVSVRLCAFHNRETYTHLHAILYSLVLLVNV
jgi:hypothetical protein